MHVSLPGACLRHEGEHSGVCGSLQLHDEGTARGRATDHAPTIDRSNSLAATAACYSVVVSIGSSHALWRFATVMPDLTLCKSTWRRSTMLMIGRCFQSVPFTSTGTTECAISAGFWCRTRGNPFLVLCTDEVVRHLYFAESLFPGSRSVRLTRSACATVGIPLVCSTPPVRLQGRANEMWDLRDARGAPETTRCQRQTLILDAKFRTLGQVVPTGCSRSTSRRNSVGSMA